MIDELGCYHYMIQLKFFLVTDFACLLIFDD